MGFLKAQVTRRELVFTTIGAFVAVMQLRSIPAVTDEQIAELILYGTGENLPIGFLDCSNYITTKGG